MIVYYSPWTHRPCETRGDADYKTHQGRGHGWKQSGIRGDVRPVTHKEGQVTWNERRVTFLNKTGSSQDKKKQNKTGHPSLRCDRYVCVFMYYAHFIIVLLFTTVLNYCSCVVMFQTVVIVWLEWQTTWMWAYMVNSIYPSTYHPVQGELAALGHYCCTEAADWIRPVHCCW